MKAQALPYLRQPPPVADAQVLPLGSSALPPSPPAPRPSGCAVVLLFHAVLSYYAPQPRVTWEALARAAAEFCMGSRKARRQYVLERSVSSYMERAPAQVRGAAAKLIFNLMALCLALCDLGQAT